MINDLIRKASRCNKFAFQNVHKDLTRLRHSRMKSLKIDRIKHTYLVYINNLVSHESLHVNFDSSAFLVLIDHVFFDS